MVENLWTTIAYSSDVWFREYMGKGQDRALQVRMSARSKRPEYNEEQNSTVSALMVEGDCVLDFCLE